jgi:hypothetical protein
MRLDPMISATAGTREPLVHGEVPLFVDSRYGSDAPLSPLQLAVHSESARLGRAVADFVAVCRAEHVPPDAVVTRFEAFLAEYSALPCSSTLTAS